MPTVKRKKQPKPIANKQTWEQAVQGRVPVFCPEKKGYIYEKKQAA